MQCVRSARPPSAPRCPRVSRARLQLDAQSRLGAKRGASSDTSSVGGRRTTFALATNQVVTQWGAVFGDDVLAAAILGRLLHHSHTLMIQGESYRLKQKKRAALLGSGSATKG